MQNKLRYILFFSVLVLLTVSKVSFAVHSSLENAKELRRSIELRETYRPSIQTTKTYNKTYDVILPVSRGFDQKDTGLCWAYAFFNALESMYMVDHPTETLELSRGAMQYINLQDRIELKIAGIEDHLDPNVYRGYAVEGGTASDAAYLVEHAGVVQFHDYHDILSPKYTNLLNDIFTPNTTPDEQRLKAEVGLPIYFGYKVPEKTFFNGKLYEAKEFGKSLLGDGKWISYAISKDGTDYVAKDPDPDARRGALTNFVSREKIVEKIKQSIAQGRPVIYSNIAHVILIYGIEYDENNKPLTFYIKDSYPGYFYKSDGTKTLDRLGEITILENK